MARISVEVSGDERAIASFSAMILRGKSFAPVLEWAKADLRKSFATNFASNGLLVGGWAPLDAEYAAWKSVRFPGAPTLVQTGELFRSLSTDNFSGAARPNEIVIGTNLRYAKFHQYGTSKMPKREIVFEPKGFARELAKRAAQWVVRGEI